MDTITFVRNDETQLWFTESGQEIVFNRRLRPFIGYYTGEQVQIAHTAIHSESRRYPSRAAFSAATQSYGTVYENISSFTIPVRLFVDWVLNDHVTLNLDYKTQLEICVRQLTAKYFGGHQ